MAPVFGGDCCTAFEIAGRKPEEISMKTMQLCESEQVKFVSAYGQCVSPDTSYPIKSEGSIHHLIQRRIVKEWRLRDRKSSTPKMNSTSTRSARLADGCDRSLS